MKRKNVELKELWKLPITQEDSIGKVYFMYADYDFVSDSDNDKRWLCTIKIFFDYSKKGQMYNGGIAFEVALVYKYTSAPFIKPQIGSFNTLIEYTNSELLNKVTEVENKFTFPFAVRHFAIFFSGHGLYEIFTSNYKILELQKGPLPA